MSSVFYFSLDFIFHKKQEMPTTSLYHILISLYYYIFTIFNVNNRNARKKCETCSKLTKKTPEGRNSGHI